MLVVLAIRIVGLAGLDVITGIEVVVEGVVVGVVIGGEVLITGVVVDETTGVEVVEVGVVEDGVVEVGEHPAIARARARTRMVVTEYIFPIRESLPDGFIFLLLLDFNRPKTPIKKAPRFKEVLC